MPPIKNLDFIENPITIIKMLIQIEYFFFKIIIIGFHICLTYLNPSKKRKLDLDNFSKFTRASFSYFKIHII